MCQNISDLAEKVLQFIKDTDNCIQGSILDQH